MSSIFDKLGGFPNATAYDKAWFHVVYDMKSHRLVFLFFSLLAANTQAQWHTNFTEAQAQARESDRPIILVFQGSDWCAPCIRLDREVWSTDVFKVYAASHFVMLKADFPRRKKNALPEAQAMANAELARRYNTGGIFPLVVVLDTDGNVLGRTGYEGLGPEDYIELLESLNPAKK